MYNRIECFMLTSGEWQTNQLKWRIFDPPFEHNNLNNMPFAWVIPNIGLYRSPLSATDEIPKDRNRNLAWKKTAMSLLTEDGPLAVPTTSKEKDAQMEIEALLSDHGDSWYKRFQRRTIRKQISSCHPLGVKKKQGFIKGEAFRLLRTNSSEKKFKTKISHFRESLIERGYPESLITATLSDIKFEGRKQALLQKCKEDKRILSFRHTIPSYGA